jgi:hypothetical protein
MTGAVISMLLTCPLFLIHVKPSTSYENNRNQKRSSWAPIWVSNESKQQHSLGVRSFQDNLGLPWDRSWPTPSRNPIYISTQPSIRDRVGVDLPRPALPTRIRGILFPHFYSRAAVGRLDLEGSLVRRMQLGFGWSIACGPMESERRVGWLVPEMCLKTVVGGLCANVVRWFGTARIIGAVMCNPRIGV